MAKIKNVSGLDLVVPWLGSRLVLAGQVVDVPDDSVWAYTQQATWEPVDDAALAAHEAGAEQYQPEPEPEPAVLEQPPGNAPRKAWVAYVTAAGLATLEDLDGLRRDEIRDIYQQEV